MLADRGVGAHIRSFNNALSDRILLGTCRCSRSRMILLLYPEGIDLLLLRGARSLYDT